MGMYDEIHFEKPPIVNQPELLYFQTKSLENIMQGYRITEDGRFQEEDCVYREPREDEKYKIGEMTLPFMVKEFKGWKDTNFTGEVYCYDCKDGIWYDIILVVIYGKVDKMEVSQRKMDD